MLFVIRFIDRADQQALRQQYLQAHIDWLDARRESILVAGSLRLDEDDPPVGALWVVDAENRSAAIEVFKTDPFWVNGLRQGYEIHYWSKAFPDEQALV